MPRLPSYAQLPGDTVLNTAFRRRAAEDISCSALTRCRAASAKAAHRGRSRSRLRTAQAILRQGSRVGLARLEAACRRALWFGDPRYHTIKAILRQGLDHEPLPDEQQAAPLPKTAAFARSVAELRPAALAKKGVSHG